MTPYEALQAQYNANAAGGGASKGGSLGALGALASIQQPAPGPFSNISAGAFYAGMQNAYRSPSKFPRSRESQEKRMTQFVRWKREQIAQRRWRHAALTIALLLGLPILVAAVSLVWRFAIQTIVG